MSGMTRVLPHDSLGADAAPGGSFATGLLAVHFYLGDGCGFHRDEQQFLDDSRHLAYLGPPVLLAVAKGRGYYL